MLVELGVGLALAVCLVAIRVALTPLVGDRVPFMTVALGMVLATVLAGWRSGFVAFVVGQVLTWFIVIGASGSFIVENPQIGWGLVVTSVAQLIILAILALYQREVAKGAAERERRVELLSHAVSEIDHRTRNNYQTVISLVQLQAQRSDDPNVAMALRQVAERIGGIAAATNRLGTSSEDIATVRLAEHLGDLCRELNRGFASSDRRIHCELDDVTVSAEKAGYLSIIVNELVTNALKHAFADGQRGTVRVQAIHTDGALELSVMDDGGGFSPRKSGRQGIGMKLVETFAKQIGATHELMSTDKGTTHSLRLPTLQ